MYQASRLYELPALESFTKHYIEYFDDEISMYDILRITRDVFSTLPEDETWLPNYIERNLQQHLKIGNPESNLDELYKVHGQDHQFDNTVLKIVVDMLSLRLRSREDTLEELAEEPVTSLYDRNKVDFGVYCR